MGDRGFDNECDWSWRNMRCDWGWWLGKVVWWRRYLEKGEEGFVVIV